MKDNRLFGIGVAAGFFIVMALAIDDPILLFITIAYFGLWLGTVLYWILRGRLP